MNIRKQNYRDMLSIEDTKLEVFSFSDDDNDKFYSLTNLKKNPDGLDIQKLSKTSPLKLDEVLNQMGCIVLLSSGDVEKLVANENIDTDNLHQEIYRLSEREGLL